MKYKETTCSCQKCVSMCKDRPCWPTPEEAERLIENGFADKLMLDWWCGGGEGDTDIYLLGPAIEGHEGQRAPYWPWGRCNLLTKDGLCSLHDKGLKPLEGRAASCKTNKPKLHGFVAMTWNCDLGRAVVAKWKTMMGLDD